MIQTLNKLYSLLFLLLISLTIVGCEKKEKTILKVGTPEMNGDFVDGFGSNRNDEYVCDLIHGYSTLVETENSEFVWDTEAVLETIPTTSIDEDGNKTYTFKLHEDLKWNNGEKITAKDYVAYLLLQSSQDWRSIATSALAGYYLVGYELYSKGESTGRDMNWENTYDENYTVLDEVFRGVRLISEYEFSCIIAAKNLPYFYETTMVSAFPIDVDTYLPGFDIKDDGKGAYITDVNAKGTIREVIAISINNTKTGQLYKPTVTSGPYQFVKFVNQTAIVELNPYYKTNYEGKKPTIDEIHVMYIKLDSDVDQVIAGTVDIVPGVIESDKIEAARDADTTDLISYPRNGYGLLAFACYYEPTQYEEVRRAIGYLIDRNIFVNEFLSGYGSIVNGPYGESQWFYQETKDELNSQLINYTLDIDKANKELDNSPYQFESDGVTPWNVSKAIEGSNYFRYNDIKEQLAINHLGTQPQLTTFFWLNIRSNAWKAGINYTVTEAGFDALLENYYYGYKLDRDKRIYHSFNLSTNFYSDYNPYYLWHTNYCATTNNPSNISDYVMDLIMKEMHKLDPTNKERFKELFIDFVVRWNHILPQLPLYSNEYFDVYNNRVTGLKTTPTWSWADDICDIKIAENNQK